RSRGWRCSSLVRRRPRSMRSVVRSMAARARRPPRERSILAKRCSWPADGTRPRPPLSAVAARIRDRYLRRGRRSGSRNSRSNGLTDRNHEPMEPLSKAVEHLARGEWQKAHEIVQDDESPLAAWLHGIVHTLEGDLDNARYWYRAAGRTFPGAGAVQ